MSEKPKLCKKEINTWKCLNCGPWICIQSLPLFTLIHLRIALSSSRDIWECCNCFRKWAFCNCPSLVYCRVESCGSFFFYFWNSVTAVSRIFRQFDLYQPRWCSPYHIWLGFGELKNGRDYSSFFFHFLCWGAAEGIWNSGCRPDLAWSLSMRQEGLIGADFAFYLNTRVRQSNWNVSALSNAFLHG